MYRCVEKLDSEGRLLPTSDEIAGHLEDEVDSSIEGLSALPKLVLSSVDTQWLMAKGYIPYKPEEYCRKTQPFTL